MEKLDRITGLTLDEERALYHLCDAAVNNCVFAGPADGESALKEARNIVVDRCTFSLRYPLWHVHGFSLVDSKMDGGTRAALWYTDNGSIERCYLGGVKALRECSDVTLRDCTVESAEFGWKCDNISLFNSTVTAEYLFLDSRNVRMENSQMHGKYSFQYVEGLVIENCNLDTKDAFWHTKNVTVKNSVIKGEYLAWFSDGLTLINCKIIGTQPLCYCKKLKLINCTMEQCDLAFEYSEVDADIVGHIDSVKNPLSGTITADSIGDIIRSDAVMECRGTVELRV